MHGSTETRIFLCAGTERLASSAAQPASCSISRRQGSFNAGHAVYVSRWQLRGDRYAAVEASCCAAAAPGLRTGGERERGKNMQESRRRTHQAAARRRQFSAARLGGRGARAATTTDRDTRPRGAARARRDVSGRHGPESPRLDALACWGAGAGRRRRTWALPPVLTAWRRPPAAGRSEVSGAVGLLSSSGSDTAARQRLLRGDRGNVDRRHRRTCCLVPPFARAPPSGRGALLARSQPCTCTHARQHVRAHVDPT